MFFISNSSFEKEFHSKLDKSKKQTVNKKNIGNTVESLEFVVAQFSWNLWVPLILEFTSSMKQ